MAKLSKEYALIAKVKTFPIKDVECPGKSTPFQKRGGFSFNTIYFTNLVIILS